MAHTDSGAAAIVMVSDRGLSHGLHSARSRRSVGRCSVCGLDLLGRRRSRRTNAPWTRRPTGRSARIRASARGSRRRATIPGCRRVRRVGRASWPPRSRPGRAGSGASLRRTGGGVGGPSRRNSWATEISSVRLRCTAFQYAHRKVKTPIANSVIAVTAPTHCAVVENAAAAYTAVRQNTAVATTFATTMPSPALATAARSIARQDAITVP